MDKLMVQNTIARNISETSHAYTYIKPKIIKNDGRVEMGSLKAIYQNPDMQDIYINDTKQTLENVSYKSNRAMKFEIFSGKFQNAVNVLETYGRVMHDEDIMEMIWLKLQSAEFPMFVSYLKVEYRRNR